MNAAAGGSAPAHRGPVVGVVWVQNMTEQSPPPGSSKGAIVFGKRRGFANIQQMGPPSEGGHVIASPSLSPSTTLFHIFLIISRLHPIDEHTIPSLELPSRRAIFRHVLNPNHPNHRAAVGWRRAAGSGVDAFGRSKP